MQTIAVSVQGLSAGLSQVQAEVQHLQAVRLAEEDRFVQVMQVSLLSERISLKSLTREFTPYGRRNKERCVAISEFGYRPHVEDLIK